MEGDVDRMSNVGECMIRMSENKGSNKHLIEQTCKKYVKGMNVSSIADALEEDESRIKQIIQTAKLFVPDYDTEKIYAAMQMEVQQPCFFVEALERGLLFWQ